MTPCQIWKWDLELADLPDSTVLHLPLGCTVLSVANQGEKLVVWAQVDPNEERTVRQKFHLVGTGQDFKRPVNSRFLGTVLFRQGTLVVHVYMSD